MTGLPIPDDWNGVDWECIEVQWPKSTKWLGIFAGLLSTMHRGRTWDENTGLITDVQGIGRDIWDANIPFNLCGSVGSDGGDGDDGGIPDFSSGGYCAIDFTEIYQMSLCGYNPDAFKIENGVLYVRNFCGEWVSIGTVTGSQPPPDEIILPDPLPDGMETPTACAKALKIAKTQKAILTAAFDAIQGANLAWGWIDFIDDVNAAVPSMDLGNQDLLGLFFEVFALNTAGLQSETLSDDFVQALACHYVDYLDDSFEGIDGDTYKTLKDIDKTAIGTVVSDTDYLLGGQSMRFAWEKSLEAMGSGDIKKLTTGVIPVGTEDCHCPGYDFVDDWYKGYDWVVDWKFSEGTPYGLQLRVDNGISAVTSAGLTMTNNTTGSETLGAWRSVITNTGVVKAYHLEWYMGLPFIAADWGINSDIVGLSELKGYVVDDGGNNYHLTLEGITRNVADVCGSCFGLSSFQGSYDDTKNPKFPVVTRLVVAGTGAYPFA